MASLNKALLIGNLGKDPEIKVTQSGKKCAKFSLATTERFKDRVTGESKDATEWHNIVAWGTSADNIERMGLRKGISLYVEGKITNRSWDDPSGQKKYITEVILERFQILTPRSASQGSESAQSAPEPSYDGATTDPDDLPF